MKTKFFVFGIVLALLLAGCTRQSSQSPPSLPLRANPPSSPDANQPMTVQSDGNALAPQAQSLAVTVVDANANPVSGLWLLVIDALSGNEIGQSRTDGAGKALFGSLRVSRVSVSLVDENVWKIAQGSAQANLKAGKTQLVLQVVRVVDDSNAGWASQTVDRTVMLDDSAFSPSLLYVLQGSTLALTVQQSTYNPVTGGADVNYDGGILCFSFVLAKGHLAHSCDSARLAGNT